MALAVARSVDRAIPGHWPEVESAAGWGLFRALAEFDGRGKFAAYAVQFIRREALQAIRKDGKRGMRLTPPGPVGIAGLDGPLPGREPDPAATAGRDDSAAALLRMLPPGPREAARLVGLEGLSQAEAGRRMGRSQVEVSRLLKLCRTYLEDRP